MAETIGLITSISQLIGLGIKTCEYIEAVKGGPREKTAITSEILGLVGLLIRLRSRAENVEQKHGDKALPWTTTTNMLVPLLRRLQSDLEVVVVKIAPGQDHQVMKIRDGVLWPWKERQCKDMLARIARLIDLVQIALQETSIDLLNALKDDTDLLPSIESGVTFLHQDKQDELRRKILTWISPMDFTQRHRAESGKRMENSGSWFLQSSTFQSWLHEHGKVLWCSGIPGAGKTVMMSAAIDLTQNVFGYDKKTGVAYVYFDYGMKFQFGSKDIIRSIYRQVMSTMTTIPDNLSTAWRFSKEGAQQLDDSSILSFLEYEASQRKLYVVLDALDECSPDELATLLKSLQSIKPEISLLMSSRPLDSIGQHLGNHSRIEISADELEMEKYVYHRLQHEYTLARFVKKTPEFREEIVRIAVKKAQKMFLLLRLHMDSLASHETMKEVRKQLHSLPEELDLTYEDAVNRILAQKQSLQNLAIQSLSWISHAVRPLTLAELSHAISIQVGETDFDVDNIPIDVGKIIGSCAGLVVVNPADDVVRFVHYTTQEYFSRVRQIKFPTACVDITNKCLTYLLYNDICYGPHNRDSLLDQYPLLAYVACHWGKHARGESETDSNVQAMALRLLEMPSRRSDDFMVTGNPLAVDRDTQSGSHWMLWHDPRDIHIASSFGLEHLVSLLLQKGYDVNQRDKHGQTPIHWAAQGGYYSTVRFLISHGADVNATTSWNGTTALVLASMRGFQGIVELLVENGADVNSPCFTGIYGMAALHEACCFGHLDTINYLLDHGAKLVYEKCRNAAGEPISERVPALRCAVESGIETFQLLIDRGADTGGIDGWQSIKRAIEWRRPEYILALRKANADIRSTPDGERSNIEWAGLHTFVPCIAALEATVLEESPQDCNARALQRLSQQEWFTRVESTLHEVENVDHQLVHPITRRKCYKRDDLRACDQHFPLPYIGFIIPDEIKSIQYIQITVESHDQGWSDYPDHHNTYAHSYTWFTLFVQLHTGDTLQPVEHELQRNVHACGEWRTHTILLERGGTNSYVTDTLSRLRPGDVVHVIARAAFPGWTNYVKCMEVEIAG